MTHTDKIADLITQTGASPRGLADCADYLSEECEFEYWPDDRADGARQVITFLYLLSAEIANGYWDAKRAG